ncbi:MAG: dihydrodipicolinate synthase family protein [Isosphaeraceae bacterium]
MTIGQAEVVHQLFPAVPVPFRRSRRIDPAALDRYAAWMAEQPVGGVAVWAHTGRGLFLTDQERETVLLAWRRALPAGRMIIAAAGAVAGEPGVTAALQSARAMAAQAADLGADALLVHPPVAFRDRPDRDTILVDYHATIAEAGLPLVLFYLYEAAGGISYSPQILAELLARPEVIGIKVATLERVMTFQDIVRQVNEQAPSKLIITGEDRFLGYSLMCGAQAALIGMAAACTALQADMLRSYWTGQADRFLARSAAVDDLAQTTFIAPMEGYIQRMLWCLVHQGIIPAEAAFDPWAPRLEAAEFERIGECVKRVGSGEWGAGREERGVGSRE